VTRLNEIEEKNTIEVVNGSMKGNVGSSHDACNQQQIYSFENGRLFLFKVHQVGKNLLNIVQILKKKTPHKKVPPNINIPQKTVPPMLV
jgi:hypothetical protein